MEKYVNKFLPLMLIPFFTSAYSSASDFYGELSSSYAISKIDDEKFNPLALEARLGMYLDKQVGLEAYLGSGVREDTRIDIDLTLSQLAGVNFRFESPEQEGMKVFLLLGYGMSEWDVDRSNTGEPGKVDFDDFSYGGGFEWRLGNSKNWFLNLRGQRFLNKEELSLDTGSLGVRYAF